MTPRRRCRLSLSLRSLCHIFYDPVSKIKPLCIGPIMSAKADKGDRKREIEQSPMKKKFRDSAISKEDLDELLLTALN